MISSLSTVTIMSCHSSVRVWPYSDAWTVHNTNYDAWVVNVANYDACTVTDAQNKSFNVAWDVFDTIIEPPHEISNNVVCATSKGTDQPAHMRSLIRAFASRLNFI